MMSRINSHPSMLRPILKYRGGKYKEIPFISKYIPTNYDTYIEPFFGGGALFFYLQPRQAIINDLNEPLMKFYMEAQEKYDIFRKELNQLHEEYENNQREYRSLKNKNPEKIVENKNEKLYYQIRDMFNGKIEQRYLWATIYFFINKTAYSGMIRYNLKGEYNVPFGRYQNFNTQLFTSKHNDLLKKTSIYCGDYAEIFQQANPNDFMFLDPPYDCTFNDYGNLKSENGFCRREHERLALDFRELKCKALMIIGKTSFTEKLYKGYIREEYFKSYAVNIRNRFKSEAKHLIVSNF